MLRRVWTGANAERDGEVSPGLFSPEARDLGWSSVFRGLEKCGISLPMLGLAESCRDTEVWEKEELCMVLMWSPGL